MSTSEKASSTRSIRIWHRTSETRKSSSLRTKSHPWNSTTTLLSLPSRRIVTLADMAFSRHCPSMRGGNWPTQSPRKWGDGSVGLPFLLSASLRSPGRKPPSVPGAPATVVRLVVPVQPPHLAPVSHAKCCLQFPRRLCVLGTRARNKLHPAQEPGGVRAVCSPGHQQHLTNIALRLQGKQQPAVLVQRIQPNRQRLGGGGVHIEHIATRQRSFGAGPSMHNNLGKLRQIGGSLPRQFRLNLIGVHPARLPHQHGQHGRIVSSARAHVDYVFALLGSQRAKAHCVQAWLPIVQPPASAQGDDYILVQYRRVVRHGLPMAAGGRDLPRSRPHKSLPGNRCQGSGNLAPHTDVWSHTGQSRNVFRVEPSTSLKPLCLALLGLWGGVVHPGRSVFGWT